MCFSAFKLISDVRSPSHSSICHTQWKRKREREKGTIVIHNWIIWFLEKTLHDWHIECEEQFKMISMLILFTTFAPYIEHTVSLFIKHKLWHFGHAMQIANGQQDHNLMEIHYYALTDSKFCWNTADRQIQWNSAGVWTNFMNENKQPKAIATMTALTIQFFDHDDNNDNVPKEHMLIWYSNWKCCASHTHT